MPKVSVIIPAYNAMNYLSETLDSVLKQTFADFEVLIINDGSSDGIVQWFSGLGEKRVQLISQENQRIAAARNTGISHAKGEYIAFLDADDLWEPTKLEKQVRFLENHPSVGIVHTWTRLIDPKSQPTGRILTSPAEGNPWLHLIQKNTIMTSSVMLRSVCLQTVGGFSQDLHYCEDTDLWIRLAASYTFGIVKEPLTSYRLHPGTLSTNCPEVLQSFRILIERAFESVPTELLYLRNRAYGHQIIYLAWRSLNNRDYKQAIHYRDLALAYYPQIIFSWKCLRLSLAIATLQWLKPDGYSRVLALIYTLRRRTSPSITQ